MTAPTAESKEVCADQVATWTRLLVKGDELSKHRAIRDLVACEAADPVAFAAAAADAGLDAAVASSSIARLLLAKRLKEGIGVTLGAAQLAVEEAAPVELLIVAQRWYEQASAVRDGGAYAVATARALGQVLRIVATKESEIRGEMRELCFGELESLVKMVSRESGLAMMPPPETPAQKSMREAHLTTMRGLRDRLHAKSNEP